MGLFTLRARFYFEHVLNSKKQAKRTCSKIKAGSQCKKSHFEVALFSSFFTKCVNIFKIQIISRVKLKHWIFTIRKSHLFKWAIKEMAWQKVEVQFWTLKLSSCDGHLYVHVLYLNNYAFFLNSGFAEVKQGTHKNEIFEKKILNRSNYGH